MISVAVISWIKKRARIEAWLSWFVALVCLGTGLILIVGTLALAYTSFHLVFATADYFLELHLNEPSSVANLLTGASSFGFLLFLFLGNSWLDRESLRQYSRRRNARSRNASEAAGLLANLTRLVVRPIASSGVIPDLLYAAPRVMQVGVHYAKAGLRLAALDAEECARVLVFLLQKQSAASFEELSAMLGREPFARVAVQLKEIDGVLFLPSRLTLTQDVRRELHSLGVAFKQAPPPKEDPPPQEPAESESTPYEILGITPAATPEEIKAAYRKCIKDWHPDQFTNHGLKFLAEAEERTKEINRAYEELTRLAA
jgi:DnaJ-domain-containing protein 1